MTPNTSIHNSAFTWVHMQIYGKLPLLKTISHWKNVTVLPFALLRCSTSQEYKITGKITK
jgi:hypothetical protein